MKLKLKYGNIYTIMQMHQLSVISLKPQLIYIGSNGRLILVLNSKQLGWNELIFIIC